MTSFFDFRTHQHTGIVLYLLIAFFERLILAIYALGMVLGFVMMLDAVGVPPIGASREPGELTAFGEWFVPWIIPSVMAFYFLVYPLCMALGESRQALREGTVLAGMRMKTSWIIKWNPLIAPISLTSMLVRWLSK